MLCVLLLCVALVAGGSVDIEVNITKLTNGHTTLFESEPFTLSLTLLRWPQEHNILGQSEMCVAAGGGAHTMTLIGTRCVQVSRGAALSGPLIMLLRFNLGSARRVPYTLTVTLGDVDVATTSNLRLRVVAHHYPDTVYLLPATPITITVPPRRSFVFATQLLLSETTPTSIAVTLHTDAGDVDYFVLGEAPDDYPNTWQVPWSRGFSTNGIVAVYNNASVRVSDRVYVVIFGHEGYLSSRVNVSAVVGGDHHSSPSSSSHPPAATTRWDNLWWALSMLMEILSALA